MLSTLAVSLIVMQLKSKEAPAPVVEKPITRPAPSKVLAYVDKEPITGAEVEKYLWDWREDEIVTTLINYKVVDQAAKKLHITATPAELAAELDQALAATRQSQHGQGDVWATLRSQGYPRSRVELTVKSIVLLNKITLRDFNPKDYVDISMIFVKPNPPTQDPKAVMQTAQGYYDEIQKGKTWGAVLAESTQDARVIGSDGRLGLKALAQFPPESAAEIKSLKPGQVTKPAQTPAGVQIFKLNAFGDTSPAGDLKQVQDQFIAQHRPEVMKRLRDQAKVVTIQ